MTASSESNEYPCLFLLHIIYERRSIDLRGSRVLHESNDVVVNNGLLDKDVLIKTEIYR